MIRTFIGVLFILLCVQCEKKTALEFQEFEIFIQANLYANQPINDICVFRMPDFVHGQTDYRYEPVNDANISVFKNSKKYQLISSSGDSGFYQYNGNDLTVEPGDIFTMNVLYHEQLSTSTVMIPTPPAIEIETDTIRLTMPDESDDALTIYWTGPKASIVSINDDFYAVEKLTKSDDCLVYSYDCCSEIMDQTLIIKNCSEYLDDIELGTGPGSHLAISIFNASNDYHDGLNSAYSSGTIPVTGRIHRSNFSNGIGLLTGFASWNKTFYIIK